MKNMMVSTQGLCGGQIFCRCVFGCCGQGAVIDLDDKDSQQMEVNPKKKNLRDEQSRRKFGPRLNL